MRAATIASVAALASTSVAAPWWGHAGPGGRPSGRPGGRPWGPPGSYNGSNGDNGEQSQCMTAEEGEEYADVFRALIQEYSDEVALEYLAEDFVDFSSSVNGIINAGGNTPFPLDEPTFNSRQEFMDGQGAQPEIPFEKHLVLPGCDFVTMKWSTSDSAAGQETKVNDLISFGNVIVRVKPNTEDPENGHRFRVSEIHSEFSNAAWLVNLGIFEPDPSAIDTEAKKSKRDLVKKSLRGNMI